MNFDQASQSSIFENLTEKEPDNYSAMATLYVRKNSSRSEYNKKLFMDQNDYLQG